MLYFVNIKTLVYYEVHELDVFASDPLYLLTDTDVVSCDKRPNSYYIYDVNLRMWKVSPELIVQELRTIRDEKLRSTDWTQLPDTDLTGPCVTEFRAYRQHLRDVPNNEALVQDIINNNWTISEFNEFWNTRPEEKRN